MLIECYKCNGDGCVDVFSGNHGRDVDSETCPKCNGEKHIEEPPEMVAARLRMRNNLDKVLRALQSALAANPALSRADLQNMQKSLKDAYCVLEWQKTRSWECDW